jgi:HK97 family phage portal protein
MSIFNIFKQKQTIEVEPNNQLWQQLFYLLNTDHPIYMADKPKEYVTKGYVYNDLIYSIIKTKQDIAKSINWLAYKVTDEKAYRQMNYAIKGVKAGLNVQKNTNDAIHYRKKALEEVSGTLVNKFLEKPNSHQTFNEIVEELFGWFDITGNFYLYGLEREDRMRTLQSIHVAPAQNVEIVAGDWLNPIEGYKLKHYYGNQTVIPADQVLHIKNWNPDYDTDGRQLYGLSPLRAGTRILELDNAGLDTSTASYQNSGVRGLIHALANNNGNQNFTAEQAALIKTKIESWTGTSKANSLAATNAPVGYTEIGKSPVDLGVMQAMDKNMVRLCNLLQSPVELYLPGTTFSNKAEARKNLITTGILPKMELFKDKMNKWAIERFNTDRDKYIIDYDLFSIAELQDDLTKITNMYKGMDWVTINEKREAMNYGTYENDLADTLFVQPFAMPIDQVNYSTDIEEVDKQLKKLGARAYE